MLNPLDSSTPLFEFGGPDSGIEANFDIYVVSDHSNAFGLCIPRGNKLEINYNNLCKI